MNISKPKEYFVYIMSNGLVIVIYVGSTDNLIRRIWQHKHKLVDNAFTKKYNVNKLLYFEKYPNREESYRREKEIKGLSREKKMELIRTMNPQFKDLSADWWRGKL